MNIPITDGLVLRLESINGVLVVNGVVIGWDDTSGSGNDLDQSSGDPTLQTAATPTGEDAVVFDGVDDALSRLSNIAGLPAGSDDRTMFIVTEYTAVDSYAGFSYGNDRNNQAFGLIASQSDDLSLQGWGVQNDFATEIGAVASGWMVHSVVLEDGQFNVYRDGILIDSGDHVFATVVNQLSLAQNLNGNGENGMAVSAVLVYDNALNVNDRLQTEAYLRETYIGDNGVDDAPTTYSDTYELLGTSVQSLDVLDNDFDDMGFDTTSVTIVSGPSNGSVTSINPLTGAINYQPFSSGQSDSFTYQVADSAGNLSDPTTVNISVEGVPLFDLGGFTQEVVVSEGLGQPLSIAFLPDNRMIVIEKSGRVLIADPETGNSSVYMQLSNINSGNERGLLDITLDPDFANNGYFYVYYTPGSPQNARISRFTHEENSGGLTSTANTASELVLWHDTDGYDACCHYGGGLDFGPDGKLWLTTSDKFDTSTPGEGDGTGNLPIDLTSTSGKLIRINKDGSIPDGTDGWPANPYIDLISDPNSEIPDSIWAYGLRNPFRARWDIDTGNFYIAEVGGNQDGLSHESVHIGSLDQPGVFYGWPFYEGVNDTLVNPNEEALRVTFPQPDGDLGDPANGDYYSSPFFSYERGGGASLTGGFVYRGDMFPSEWDGVYFYGDYTRDFIKFLVLDPTGLIVQGSYDFKPTDDLPDGTPNLVFLDEGADGALYYINFGATGGQITRVSYDSGNVAPAIGTLDIAPTGATDTYSFMTTVSDDDGDTLVYTLQFGDGTSVSGAPDAAGLISVEHTYTAEGAYAVSLQVSDGSLTVFSSPQTVTIGDPNDAPEVTNVASDLEQVTSGVTVNFSADAFDADGDAMSYVWVFGDGSTETGVVDVSGHVTASHAYATDGTYSARLEVSDGALNTLSSSVTVSVGETTAIPVTSGLILILESTIKIGLYGSAVTAWLDGSGNGNNFTATGDPQYVLGATPSGLPALVFDGDGDSLFRDNETGTPIVGLPSGQSARSFFLVTQYEPANDAYAGFTYGNNANDEAFGLVNYGPYNQLAIQGWGGQNDNRSNVNAGEQGWIVQSVVMQSDGSYIHYMNGVEIDSGQNDFDTVVDHIVIAANIGGQGETEMSVAAIAGFDRALTEIERMAVETYFQDTYLSAPVPTPPIAADDTFAALEGTALNVTAALGLLSNDEDADNDGLVVTQINGVDVVGGQLIQLSDGDLTINGDGSFSFAVDAGFNGSQSFAYTVSDNTDGTDTANVTINTTSAPVAADDAYTVDTDVSLVVDAASGLLANDTDADGDTLSVAEINGVAVTNGETVALANGDLTINTDGSFTFAPDAGFSGDQAFAYTVSDGQGGTATATSIVTVDAPAPGGTLPVTAGLVLSVDASENVTLVSGTDTVSSWLDGSGSGNDFAATGDPQYVLGATPSGHAAIVFDGNGDSLFRDDSTGTPISGLPSGQGARSFFLVTTYEPGNDAYAGFSYGNDSHDEAFGLINYGSHNRLAIQGWGGQNDNRSDVNAGEQGWIVQSVVMQSDGSYIHYMNGVAIDSGQNDFDTVVNHMVIAANIGSSGETAMSVAAVLGYDRALTEQERSEVDAYLQNTYLAASVPVPPVAVDDIYATAAETTLTANTLQGLLANDTDADGDTLSVTEINGASVTNGETVALANGDLTIDTDGSFVFTPDAGFSGDQVFDYTVADGVTGTDTATATISVAAPASNTPPVATDDAFTGGYESALVVDAASGLLANDSDVDGDPLSIAEINGVAVTNGETVALANGDLTINTDGSFTFAPDAGFSGDQAFAYTVSDGQGGTATATSIVTVDAPAPGGTLPVVAGLVVALDASENVALVGGTNTVSGWLDGSGFGTDLFVTGDPELVANATPTGESAIYLDGVGDTLVREGGENLSNLPSGSGDRTIFFVVDYESAARMSGVVYGDNQHNQTFGLATSGNSNLLSVQGWGSQHDNISGTSTGNNDGVDEWLVQSVVLSNDQMSHYLNGVLIDTDTHTYATDTTDASSRFVIGEEIGNLGFGAMSVASVLIFDRALTEIERADVEQYLQDRYITVTSSQLQNSTSKDAPIMEAVGADPDTVSTADLLSDDKALDTPIMEVLGAIATSSDEFDFSGLSDQSAPSNVELTATMTGATGSSVLKDLFSQGDGLVLDYRDNSLEDWLDGQIFESWDAI